LLRSCVQVSFTWIRRQLYDHGLIFANHACPRYPRVVRLAMTGSSLVSCNPNLVFMEPNSQQRENVRTSVGRKANYSCIFLFGGWMGQKYSVFCKCESEQLSEAYFLRTMETLLFWLSPSTAELRIIAHTDASAC
jgi:hypothetical protein